MLLKAKCEQSNLQPQTPTGRLASCQRGSVCRSGCCLTQHSASPCDGLHLTMKKARKLVETVFNGATFRIGDACLINPDTSSLLPFIGKIVDIHQTGSREEDVVLKVVWFYRPEEALGGRKAFHGEKELFESDHTDEIHRNTLIGHCFVHSLRAYVDLPHIGDNDFFTRFMYKPAKKEFEPDKVPVYCTCEQPYNPDKPMVLCESCKDWYHPDCIGVSVEMVQHLEQDRFCCPQCAKVQRSNKKPRVAG